MLLWHMLHDLMGKIKLNFRGNYKTLPSVPCLSELRGDQVGSTMAQNSCAHRLAAVVDFVATSFFGLPMFLCANKLICSSEVLRNNLLLLPSLHQHARLSSHRPGPPIS